MKNKLRSIMLLISSFLIMGTIGVTAIAETFTPTRIPIAFPANGASGLPYNSFNNYTGNEAIWQQPRDKNEMVFTTVTECEPGKETLMKCGNALHADGLKNLEDGDVVEFEIYFHNNAEDPFDGGKDGPLNDATNVNIGMDLSNVLKPIGFISANNVEYRGLWGIKMSYSPSDYAFEDNSASKVGKPVKTVSDDVTLSSTEEFELEILPNTTAMLIAYDHDGNNIVDTKDTGANEMYNSSGTYTGLNKYYYGFVPAANTTFNIVTVTTTRNEVVSVEDTVYKPFPITVKTVYDSNTNKVYLNFNKLPGCLRYSGFAWFRAKVKFLPPPPAPENFCTSLMFTDESGGTPTCDPTTLETPFNIGISFLYSIWNWPAESVTFKSTDPAGQVAIAGRTYENIPATGLTKKITNGYTMQGKYKGYGTLSMVYTDANGVEIKGKSLFGAPLSCSATFNSCTPPPPIPACQPDSLSVEVKDITPTNPLPTLTCLDRLRMIRFSAKSFTTPDGTVISTSTNKLKVRWTTTDPNGQFQIDDPHVPRMEVGPNAITSENQAVIYTGGGSVSAQLIAVDGKTSDTYSLCKWTLPECNKCGSLTATFNDGTDYIYIGQTKQVNLSVFKAGKGTELYPSTVTWSDEGRGVFQFPIGTQFTTSTVNGIPTYATKYPYPSGTFLYRAPTTEGDVIASVKGEEDVCIDRLLVKSPYCQSLILDLYKTDGSVVTPKEFKNGEVYQITTRVTYQPINPTNINVNYSAKASNRIYGYFASAAKVTLPYVGEITVPEIDLSTWSSEMLNVSSKESIYFFINPTLAPGSYPNGVIAWVSGTEEPGCKTRVPVTVVAPNVCENIALATTPTPFDPTVSPKTKIYIDEALSSFGDYDGRFKFEITEGAEYADLYATADATTGGKDFTISKAEAVSTGVYIFGIPGMITVTVTAADAPLSGCIAVVRYIPEEVVEVCQEIELHSFPSDHFNPVTTEEFWISGNFGDYKGDFTFKITGSGNFENETKTTTVSLEEAKTGVKFLNGKNENTTVEVFATDEDYSATKCKKYINYVVTTEDTCKTLTIEKPSTPWIVDNDQDYENFRVYVDPPNPSTPWIIKWEFEGGTSGLTRFEHNTSTSLTNKLFYPKKNLKARVYVEGYKDSDCDQTITAKTKGGGGGDKTPPKFTKRVKKGALENDPSKGSWTDIVNIQGKPSNGTIPQDSRYVSFKLDFRTGDKYNINWAEIEDESINSSGQITAVRKKSLPKAGTLDVTKVHFYINERVAKICDEEEKDTCVEANAKNRFMNGQAVRFENLDDDTKINIYYQAFNNTALNEDTCAKMTTADGCGEEFINEGKVEAGKGSKTEFTDTDTAKVIATCPYVLTRAGGDSFFNSDLQTGIDISYCGPQKNIAGPIIKGLKSTEKITSSGAPNPNEEKLKTYLTSPTHDVCKFSNTEQNLDGYDNALTTFSSSICEMESEVSDKWDVDAVTKQIISNAGRVSRFATESRTWPSPQTKHIYRFNTGLIIPSSNVEITEARTYIVHGNLNIEGNITYGKNFEYTNTNAVPSAAFIVIGGNIIVGKDVQQMDGIYIVVKDDTDTGGKFTAKGGGYTYDYPLVVNGGLYGDVSDLFSHRMYVGDIASDEGSVTIRYSENFIINTPPGLNDLMDITQLKTTY